MNILEFHTLHLWFSGPGERLELIHLHCNKYPPEGLILVKVILVSWDSSSTHPSAEARDRYLLSWHYFLHLWTGDEEKWMPPSKGVLVWLDVEYTLKCLLLLSRGLTRMHFLSSLPHHTILWSLVPYPQHPLHPFTHSLPPITTTLNPKRYVSVGPALELY